MTFRRLVISFAAALCLLASCADKNEDRKFSVVVFHSYENRGEEGKYFRNRMKAEFAQNGYDVDVTHIYTDLVHTSFDYFTERIWNAHLRDSVLALSPDVIVINDDPMFSWAGYLDDPAFFDMPVVFAGVDVCYDDVLESHKNFTGYIDRIDFAQNLKFYQNVCGDNSPTIPLDYYRHDLILRDQLKMSISDTLRYFDNTSFKLIKRRTNKLGDRIVVSCISLISPDLNAPEGANPQWGKAAVKDFFADSDEAWIIQVKEDIYSPFLLNFAPGAEFTAIRNGYRADDHHLLGGFFTSVETQIADEVECVCSILDGFHPEDIPVKLHEKSFHIDYAAIKNFSKPLSYKELAENYNVDDVPFYIRHPLYFALAILLAVLALTGGAVLLDRRKKSRAKQETDISNDALAGMELTLFKNKNIYVWTIEDDWFYSNYDEIKSRDKSRISVDELCNRCVAEESKANLAKILRDLNYMGKYRNSLKLSFDSGQSWHWFDFCFEGRNTAEENLLGVMIATDDIKAAEEDISKAIDSMSEAKLKENFLANISHDIRTPLNAVTGFAQLLSDPDVSKEDAQTYSKIVIENSDILLKLIDDVAAKSAADEDGMTMNKSKAEIGGIVYNCYQTNSILVSDDVEFLFEPDKGDRKVFVWADPLRITQVINNFLSNSFRFTEKGSISLGWQAEPDFVRVYVRDTGCGIKEDKLEHVFDKFMTSGDVKGGTGLGLNICQHIVQCHGGEIKAESALGEGSLFYFDLPLYNKEDQV